MTMFHKVLFWLVAAVSVLLPACPRAEDAILRIAKQGSMEAGGRTIDCPTKAPLSRADVTPAHAQVR